MFEDLNEESSTMYALVKLVSETFLGSKLIGEWCIFTMLGDVVFVSTHIVHTDCHTYDSKISQDYFFVL